MVHDIGKVGIPDAVLLKPGPLSDDDVALMRQHVMHGVEIASRLRSAAAVVPIIKHHHERVDGGGYPDGLGGDDIPMLAMIVAICDAFDAMTSSRPYREAMTVEVATDELRRGAGTQWDADLVALFLSSVVREQPGAEGVSAPAPGVRAGSRSPGGR